MRRFLSRFFHGVPGVANVAWLMFVFLWAAVLLYLCASDVALGDRLRHVGGSLQLVAADS